MPNVHLVGTKETNQGHATEEATSMIQIHLAAIIVLPNKLAPTFYWLAMLTNWQ